MTADVQIDPKKLNLNAREPPVFCLSTVQSSTASFHSVQVNFTGPNEHNLIIKYVIIFNWVQLVIASLAKELKSKFMMLFPEE